MDFKTYSEVHLLEDHSPSKHSMPKTHRITVVLSLIITLTVVVSATFSTLTILKSKTKFQSPGDAPAESIRAVCSVAPYPRSCFTTISSIITPSDETIPELIFSLSIQVAINELTNLTSLPKTLISKSNDARTQSALQDCASLFDDGLRRLNISASSMDVDPGEKILTEVNPNHVKAWISSAMTDQEACLDGLEKVESTVLDEVRSKVQKSRVYMSNSLAIVSNTQTFLDNFYPPFGYDRSCGLSLEYMSICIFCVEFLILVFLFCLLLRIS